MVVHTMQPDCNEAASRLSPAPGSLQLQDMERQHGPASLTAASAGGGGYLAAPTAGSTPAGKHQVSLWGLHIAQPGSSAAPMQHDVDVWRPMLLLQPQGQLAGAQPPCMCDGRTLEPPMSHYTGSYSLLAAAPGHLPTGCPMPLHTPAASTQPSQQPGAAT